MAPRVRSTDTSLPEPIAFTERCPPGIRFTERMTGWWAFPTESIDRVRRHHYEDAVRRGRREGWKVELVLTLQAPDLEATLRDPHHPFGFVGSATIAGLGECSPTPRLLARGEFKLFVPDGDRITSKQMVYEADLACACGERWWLSGFKALRQGGGVGVGRFAGTRAPGPLPTSARELWGDQTRLYVRLSQAEGPGVPVFRGLGILTITASDFLRQLLTIRATGTTSRTEACDTVARFAVFFGGVLRDTYGGPFARSRYAPPNWSQRTPRRLVGVKEPRLVPLRTLDEVDLRLTHYPTEAGRRNGHVILAPGFGVRARSFAVDTVDVNLVEFLGREGYDVWLFDYRASPELEASAGEFSIDHVAQHDWPAAVREVWQQSGGGKIGVIAHCVGAMSFMMAALGGAFEDLHDAGIRIQSAICSQVGAHPMGSRLNTLKAVSRLAVFLELFGQKSLRVTVHAADTYRRPPLDRLLKYYWTEDPCDNPVCQRVRFVFGESYLHANLNRSTHDAIIEMFGNPHTRTPARASLRALRHLARILRREEVVLEDGTRLLGLTGMARDLRGKKKDVAGKERKRTGTENLKKLEIRLSLMSGRLNAIFPIRGIERTHEHFARLGVERLEPPLRLEGYAHMDCFIGARAHQEVFPELLARLG